MFKLRGTAVASLFEYWARHDGNPLVDIATGLGKSFIIGDLCRRFGDGRVLILSHVREIIDQALWPDAPVEFNSDALGERNTAAPIVLAAVQSIFRNPQALGHRDIALIDEAHLVPHGDDGMFHATLAGLRAINGNLKVAGLTATTYRLDTGRLDEGDGRLFDRIVSQYGIADGIADGWLAPLTAKATRARIDVSLVGRRGGEFIGRDLQAAAERDTLVERACDEILARAGGRRAWLIFCCGVEHSLHVRDMLRARSVSAETIVGSTPADERADIVARFRAGEITALTNCQCLTTGFDVHHIDLLVLLRPTLSTGLYVQMVGRGTRKAGGKENCLVLDFAGNTMRHGPVDAVTPNVARAGDGSSEAPAKVCPECESIVAASCDTCPDCGHRFASLTEPKHDATPIDVGVISSERDWIEVERIGYRIHHNKAGVPSLPVDCFAQAERLAARTGVSIEAAKKTVICLCEGVLLPDVELPFDDAEFAGCTVADVLADPDRFDGATLADPLEGVDYGIGKAKILRRPDGTPWIHSFAHGRTVYELRCDAKAVRAAIEGAEKEQVVDLFIRLVMIAEVDDAEVEDLRNLVCKKAGINKPPSIKY